MYLHEPRGLHYVRPITVIKFSHIPTVEITIFIDGFCGLVGHEHVPHEDMTSSVAQFASDRVYDTLGARHRTTTGAHLVDIDSRVRVKVRWL